MLLAMLRLIRLAASPSRMMNIVKVIKLSDVKEKVVFRNAVGDELIFLHDGTWWSWYPSEHRVSGKEQLKLDKAWKRYLKRESNK